MKYATLNIENPDLDCRHLNKLQAFYQGSRAVRAIITQLITKNEGESATRYKERCKQAPYLNYTGPIIDKFAAMLLASPPNAQSIDDAGAQSDPDEFWLDWRKNVDGNGTDLTQFFREQFTDSMMKKRAIWTLRMPDDGEEPPLNAAEWKERGLGNVRLEELETQNCLDWRVDSRGQLEWLIHHTSDMPRLTPDADRKTVVETWEVFTRDTVKTYQIQYEQGKPPKATDEVPLIKTWSHGLGECPIISLTMPDGLWVADRIFEAQLEHFRVTAALSWSFKASCYALPLFHLVDASRPPTLGTGIGILLDSEDSVGWLAPPTAHLAAMQDEKVAIKDEIYRIVHQMADAASNNAGTIGRSGKSKSADLFSTRTILESFAQLVRAAIERTYQMAARLRGTDTDTNWAITGLDQFDDLNIEELLNAVVEADAIGMPSEDWQLEVRRTIVDAYLPNADEATRARIMKQLSEGLKALQERKDQEAADKAELNRALIEGAHASNQLGGAGTPKPPTKPGAGPQGQPGARPPTGNAGGKRPAFGGR